MLITLTSICRRIPSIILFAYMMFYWIFTFTSTIIVVACYGTTWCTFLAQAQKIHLEKIPYISGNGTFWIKIIYISGNRNPQKLLIFQEIELFSPSSKPKAKL